MENEQNKYGWKGVYQETIKNKFISKDFENRDRYKKRHTGRRLRIICNGFQRGYHSLFQKEKSVQLQANINYKLTKEVLETMQSCCFFMSGAKKKINKRK